MRRSSLLFGLVLAATAAGGAPAATIYAYDTLGRLSTASYDNGKQIVYNYDPAGNRSSVVIQTTPAHVSQAKATRTGTPKAKARR